jgi:hypothetical protein
MQRVEAAVRSLSSDQPDLSRAAHRPPRTPYRSIATGLQGSLREALSRARRHTCSLSKGTPVFSARIRKFLSSQPLNGPQSADNGAALRILNRSAVRLASLAGVRVESHERSRPAVLPRRQAQRSPYARSCAPHCDGCASRSAVLARGSRFRETLIDRIETLTEAFSAMGVDKAADPAGQAR